MRLAQTENGSQTRYLVDTQRSYSEVVGAITPESETWYLLGLDILGQQQGSEWSYFAYDGLGSVRLALDINGSPRAGMRYEPYGQPAASWGTPLALGFTGEWTDSSGLLYLRARYLDPSSATFLSRDPFEGLPTRALSRNGYSWVEGNPINYVDPSGEIPLLAAAASVAFGAVMGAISAYSSAATLYALAYDGHCGCDAQNWARSTSRDQFLIQIAALGAIGGALGGVGIASGSGQIIKAIGGTLATYNLGKAVGEMAAYGADLCRLLNTLLALLGIGLSTTPLIPPLSGGALAFNTGGSVAVAGAASGAVAGQGAVIGGISSGIAGAVWMANEGEDQSHWTDWQAPYEIPGDSHGRIHHIATNKHETRWKPLFVREFFEKAGISINSKWNKIVLDGHYGPHPDDYHKYVYDALSEGTAGLTGEAFRHALQRTLWELKQELMIPGSYLRGLVTR